MNTSEHIPTMYESIPAVSALNRVPGFEPLKLLHRIVSPEDGKEMLQLDLRYKKLWFRLANPKGRIRLNPLRITEQMAVFEAQVYLDRSDENPVGSFTSCFTKEESPDGRYVQAAQFEAMDEALTDAGYGVQFADVSVDRDGNRYGSRIAMSDTAPAGQEGTGNSGVQTAQGALQAEKATPAHSAPGQASGMQGTGKPVGVAQAAPETAACSTGTDPDKKTMVQGQKRNVALQGQAAGNVLPIPPGNPVPGGRVSGSASSSNKGTKAKGAVPTVAQAGKPAVEKRAVQDDQMMQPGTVKKAVGQQAAPQGQNSQAVGSARAFHPVMAQGQNMQASGSGKDVRQPKNQSGTMRMPAVQARMASGSGNVLPVAPATEVQKPGQSSENRLPIQPEPVKSQAMPDAAGSLPVNAAEKNPFSVQPGIMGTDVAAKQALPINMAGADLLPVQPVTAKAEAAAAEAQPVNTVRVNSHPARAAAAKTVRVPGKALPASGKGNGSRQLHDSVQGAMALLRGQKAPAPAVTPSGAGQEPVPVGASQEGQALPVSGSMETGGAAPRYTAGMPVEEIAGRMTLEEAGKVIVETGVCRGMTIAEVAERRPPSLKFYYYGGYKGDDNILRAAAKVMLDHLEAQKAG